MGSHRLSHRTGDPVAEWARRAADDGASPIEVAAAVGRRLGRDLGLSVDPSSGPGVPALFVHRAGPDVPDDLVVDAWSVGRSHEAALGAAERKRGGVHYTPPEAARALAAIALDGAPDGARVCDPSVGGGAFLLAVGEILERTGRTRGDVIAESLWGIDIDADAALVADAAVRCWASVGGCWVADGPRLVVADTLRSGLGAFAARGVRGEEPAEARFDVVIGNPPFQSPLATATGRSGAETRILRERWGIETGPYADAAVFFVAAALELMAPMGRTVLVQPRSSLAAADAAAVRSLVSREAYLAGVWKSDELLFDAEVRVCALVIDGPDRAGTMQRVRRWSGDSGIGGDGGAGPLAPDRWASLLVDIDDVIIDAARRAEDLAADQLAAVATATAGFRQQFYGLAGHTVETVGAPESDIEGRAPLVTVGMIDPLRNRWGSTTFRFAGQTYVAPSVDLDGLAAADPTLRRWVQDRLRPKVLVATQTRVIEVVADPEGTLVPSTPVVSVEVDPARVWHVAAALSSPVATAIALGRVAGASLTIDTIKLSARQVLALPLPVDAEAWDAGADAARQAAVATTEEVWLAAMVEFGTAMVAAAGVDDHSEDVVAWWLDRLPAWR